MAVAKTKSGDSDSRDQERPRLFSRRETMARLNISESKLDELLVGGALKSVRIGRRRLVPSEAIDEFVTMLGSS